MVMVVLNYFQHRLLRDANDWRIDFTTPVANKEGQKGAFKAMPNNK